MSSGWTPCSTWRTARMRSCSNVLWSSLRPSLSRMRESNQITTTKSTYLGSAWYVIFGLVIIHMLRVFFSGGYRGPRTGLWQIGVGLAGTVFLLSTTGETLHWDERGCRGPLAHLGDL